MSATDADTLAAGVTAGDRRALARAITLVESRRDDHREQAEALLARVLEHTGNSVRLGVTGVPGVGKSSFIEAFGQHLTDHGHRLAVLAVDPSSPRSGGSVLGDKTRMPELARNPGAFVRPSPAGDTLGGVARRTREAMLLCEAAGFDVVLVETVGVGQSETAVADMVDMFLLLLVPGGGDELQGIKKGIVELADAVLVNKADGDLAAEADRAVREYRNALHLLGGDGRWEVPVLKGSARTGLGIDTLWETVRQFRDAMTADGALAAKRAAQARAWMWDEVRETLLTRLQNHPGVRDQVPAVEQGVADGTLPPGLAARRLLGAFLGTAEA